MCKQIFPGIAPMGSNICTIGKYRQDAVVKCLFFFVPFTASFIQSLFLLFFVWFLLLDKFSDAYILWFT